MTDEYKLAAVAHVSSAVGRHPPSCCETCGTLGPTGHFTTPDSRLQLDFGLRERIAVTIIQRGNSLLLRKLAGDCCPKGPHISRTSAIQVMGSSGACSTSTPLPLRRA